MTISDVIARLNALERRVHDLETNEALPIVAHYSKASGTISNATPTIVNFDTLIYDTWNAVTTGAGWVFTVPIGGYYLVIAIVGFEGSSSWSPGELAYLDVFLDGAHFARLDDRNNFSAGASIEAYVKGSAIVEAAKDQEINIVIYQGSGATQTIDADEHTYVYIARVG